MKIQIYDPPMCCPTGICGPGVDPELVRFAADLDWARRQGGQVERYNLSQEPGAFVANPLVKELLTKEGNDCLPLIVVDGAVAFKGSYPTREALAKAAGLEARSSLFTAAVSELVAIGAAIGSNCEPCFKHHYNEARKLGVSNDDMRLAVDVARAVKEAPAKSVLALADRYLAQPLTLATAAPCCGDGPTQGGGKCCG
ncbi:MAG: arsenite efflux transporter metallochaperone ArsD [bacterium]|nr:arsenite efflux transporter metallochaperone ArsD [bacterium]